MSLASADGTLICDFSAEGHRGNYVRVLGRALNAATLIAPFARAAWPALRARTLLFSTFETAPGPMFVLTLLRAFAGRPTRLIVLRPVIDGSGWRAGAKRVLHGILARLPGVRLITVMPLATTSHLHGLTHFVRDPEYWDIASAGAPSPTPLSEAVAGHAAGKRILLATGGIDPQKGMGLLADAMRAPAWPGNRLNVAIVGKTIGSAAGDVARIAESGGFVEDRYLSDEELLSLYGVAACVWCCYPPDRDMSSGVFGRARQLGVWPVVREGSMLDAECRAGGFGTAVPWAEPERAAAAVAAMIGADMAMTPSGEDAAREIAQLRTVVFGSRADVAALASG